MKSNPTISLKIPYGCFKIANKRGILSDLIFYYQLKSIRVDGYFKRGQVIDQIQTKVKLSQSRIRSKLCKLYKLGFIDRHRGNIRLLSYDRIWGILGYSNLRIENKKVKLMRVNIDYIREETYTYEIKKNLQNQRYRKRKEVQPSSFTHSATLVPSGKQTTGSSSPPSHE